MAHYSGPLSKSGYVPMTMDYRARMHNAPIVVPLAIAMGAFIFALTETAVLCTRRNLSTV